MCFSCLMNGQGLSQTLVRLGEQTEASLNSQHTVHAFLGRTLQDLVDRLDRDAFCGVNATWIAGSSVISMGVMALNSALRRIWLHRPLLEETGLVLPRCLHRPQGVIPLSVGKNPQLEQSQSDF